MRGKAEQNRVGTLERRITPACAGKSKKRHLGGWKKGDHPRVCGEKFTCFAHHSTLPGSPPRVRGKVLAAGLNDLVDGITPACAGKSEAKEFACKDGRDHPRVCGEKGHRPDIPESVRGSPPRVRGKVLR